MIFIAIDPSSTNLGIALIRTDARLRIKDIKYDTIVVNNKDPFMNTPKLYIRMGKIRETLNEVFNNDEIVNLSYESPFFNALRPGAIAPLAASIATTVASYQTFHPFGSISEFAPTVVKNAMGCSGRADKDAMREAFKKNKKVNAFYCEFMTEHEIDAIAVGLCALNKYKNDILGLI